MVAYLTQDLGGPLRLSAVRPARSTTTMAAFSSRMDRESLWPRAHRARSLLTTLVTLLVLSIDFLAAFFAAAVLGGDQRILLLAFAVFLVVVTFPMTGRTRPSGRSRHAETMTTWRARRGSGRAVRTLSDPVRSWSAVCRTGPASLVRAFTQAPGNISLADNQRESAMPARRPSPHPRGNSGGLRRITVNLTPRADGALQQAVKLTGDSKTDTLNRAIQVYAYILNVTQNGGDLYVRDKGQEELERLLMV